MGNLSKNLFRYVVLFAIAILPEWGMAQAESPDKQALLAKSDSLFAIGVELYKAKKYREAIPLFMESDKIDRMVYEPNHAREEYSRMWLASCYYCLGDTATAKVTERHYKLPPVDRRKTCKGDSLAMLALSSYYKGDVRKALEYSTLCAEEEKNMFGINHYRYANPLSFKGSCQMLLGLYAESVSSGKIALDILEHTLGKESADYAGSLNNLSSAYFVLGNYAEAIRMTTEALKVLGYTLGKEHPNYLNTLSSLATFNSVLGDYAEAIRLNTEVLETRKRVMGEEHPDYGRALYTMAGYYSSLGNHTEALRLGKMALRIQERALGKDHPQYANALNGLAVFHANLGNYAEAMRRGREALNIRGRIYGKEHPDYAAALANIANFHDDVGNYDRAIKLTIEAQGILGKVVGKEHLNYANVLNNLSYYYSHLKNYGKAIELGTEALNIRKKNLGVEHPDIANSLSNLATYYFSQGNYVKAIESETTALRIWEKTLGKEHPNYAVSLNNLALCHYAINDTSPLTTYSTEATHLCVDIVRRTFADMTAYERNLFWQKYENWFSKIIPEFAYKYPTDSLIINAYDGTLLSKGLLLNSEMEMSKLLLESGDQEAVESYTRLQQIRQTLNRLYDKPIATRQINTDSLERVVNRLERRVLRRLKAYGDYTRHLAITYKDVQKKLNKEDVAVEFVSFPHGVDSTMYVAYVLHAGKSVPQMVPLFEAGQLLGIPSEQYYTTPAISKLVWEKLSQYMEGCSNVYFAPAGELYKIAVESLPDYNGEGQISDRYNFYRLSSTRELAVAKYRSKIENAALYGGLLYDTDTQQMEADSRRYRTTETRNIEMSDVASTLDLRGGVKYLPATKIEAEYIDNSLRLADIHSMLFTDSIGTEASFKDLSGKKTNVLHLATHGFYWSEREAQMKDYLNFLTQDGNKSIRQVEDKAMTRSGLFFSGANNVLMGNPLPEDVDDGVLTAKEISTLDLRGLDLVVLSACQTGLGEITGDGVFGLQRGFKKAGAKTIMMSLWSVPDSPTQMLMTRFYDNLLVNRNPKTRRPYTKFEALKDAQQYVREFEDSDDSGEVWKPYKSPENWAGFVLLDAIE